MTDHLHLPWCNHLHQKCLKAGETNKQICKSVLRSTGLIQGQPSSDRKVSPVARVHQCLSFPDFSHPVQGSNADGIIQTILETRPSAFWIYAPPPITPEQLRVHEGVWHVPSQQILVSWKPWEDHVETCPASLTTVSDGDQEAVSGFLQSCPLMTPLCLCPWKCSPVPTKPERWQSPPC